MTDNWQAWGPAAREYRQARDRANPLPQMSAAEEQRFIDEHMNECEPSHPTTSLRVTTINARELQTKRFAPISYVLPAYIPEGVTILAGKPKVGKSWLLLDMCTACAAVRSVFGTINPSQGSVLYLALEDNQRRLKWRMNKILPSGQWPAGLELVTDCARVNEGGLEYLRNWIKGATSPVAICIDTLE